MGKATGTKACCPSREWGCAHPHCAALPGAALCHHTAAAHAEHCLGASHCPEAVKGTFRRVIFTPSIHLNLFIQLHVQPSSTMATDSAAAAPHRALCGGPAQGHGRPRPRALSGGICYSNVRAALLVSSADKIRRACEGFQDGQRAGGHCVLQPSMAAPTQPSSDHLPPWGLELL